MVVPKSKHKVYIYMNDYNAMCAEVYKYQDVETGGNLFGLWTASGDAIIHVVLGPGENCKRTSTSFHQDLEYMARVGRFVNEKYMLCHIGEWHSHHNLSLSRPSAGDESTIRRNFPQGLSKFLVIIANIRNGDTIKLSPYFFTDGGTRYEIAERVVLNYDSPFSTDHHISKEIESGRERKKTAPKPKPRLSKAVVNSPTSKSRPNPSSQDSLTNQPKLTLLAARKAPSTDNPGHAVEPLSLGNQSKSSAHTNDSSDTQVAGSAPPSTTNPSQVKPRSPDTSVGPGAPGSQDNPSESAQDDQVEPMDTDDSDLNPSTDYHAEGQNDTEMDTNDEETLSERESIIQKIYDCLKSWFGTPAEPMVKYESSENTPGAVEIRFKHNSKYWLICFPKDFPANPAKLFYCYDDSSYNKCSDFDIVQPPLTNAVSILLTIKKLCGACEVCKSLCLNVLLSELNVTLHVDAWNMKPSIKDHMEITFNLANKCWIIDFPAQFPNIPAKVYHSAHKDSTQKHDALLYPDSSSPPLDLNTFERIFLAISTCGIQ